MPKVMVVYGTRPEAIKVAPLIRELASHEFLDVQVTSTGQHRDMLRPVEAAFGLKPDVTLDSMRPGQDLTSLFSTVATGMDSVIANERPAAVVVHGDTSTAAAAALAAFHRQVPVVHLEAGLRSGDLASPFPEEGNRKLIGQVAALHLAPTMRAKSNLISSVADPGDVVVTGNTVIDALLWAEEITSSRPWPAELSALAS
ncbi:hypothetical protein ATY41_10215 [Leifsonia xyli subsp. xyli]|uniref:UDP-N-acetylglucosamine 2-epimerase (non-hydrolyzing) n=1 Tax=Leifsonia xyli subsp. xyli TaxID=59736 RepID=A0A1E2SKV4_LEIXY|nr:hypothetical protein ATY41_10215 [Leifsonia xyli subsp. xyli]